MVTAWPQLRRPAMPGLTRAAEAVSTAHAQAERFGQTRIWNWEMVGHPGVLGEQEAGQKVAVASCYVPHEKFVTWRSPDPSDSVTAPICR